MGFGTLAIIAAAGLIGPLLALRSGWNIPIVLGELLAGHRPRRDRASAGWTPPIPTFTFLADIGFALVMFVAGIACAGAGSACCARASARHRSGRSRSG